MSQLTNWLYDYESWLVRLARETRRPVAELEHLPSHALEYEIGLMLAADARDEAREIIRQQGDRDERRKVTARLADMNRSGDWFDKAVLELMGRMTQAAHKQARED